MSRSERERELRQLWMSKGGQSKVLSLYWRLRPDGKAARENENIFEVILEDEFGQAEPQ